MWLLFCALLANAAPPDETAGDTPAEPAEPTEDLPEVPLADLTIKKQVGPKFPPAGTGLARGRYECICHVVVEKNGKVTIQNITECPVVLHEASTKALKKWRFVGHRIDGEKTRVETVVGMSFKVK